MSTLVQLPNLLQQFLACASEAVQLPNEPILGRVFLAPGAEVAWDDCCSGQLWVRVVSVVPSGEPYPQPATRQNCGVVLWAANLAVGVVRCAAMVDDNGNAPPAADLTEDTLQTIADMIALETAIKCCMAPLATKLTFTNWLPLGPQGGCVGGEWAFTIALNTCACPG